jgi:uncharacterized membrane protein YbhN (UPF0104 family)
MIDWLQQLWDTLTSVSLPILALGLGFQTAQMLLVALAWRNILRAAYPEGGVRYRPVTAYYAGGVGLNAILPASAGTAAMIGLFRARIKGSTVAGLLGATVVQNIFFVVVSILVYGWMFVEVAGSFDVELGWFADHRAATVVIIVGGTALTVVVLRILYRRFRSTWENAKDGGQILSDRPAFLKQVVLVEAASYAARMSVNATFMYAFHVPVSVRNVFLIVGASGISSTLALLPGAVGVQTALATVVLKGVAPTEVITAYTVGQSLIITAWNVLVGFVLLSKEIGWPATRALMHRRKKGDGPAEPLEAAAKS